MPALNYANLPDWLQWVIGLLVLLTAAAAIIGFIRKVWPILTKFVSTVNALTDLPQFMITTAATLEAQDVKIEEIHHQTHENNGGSLKDGLKRVETTLTKNTARLTSMEKNQTRIEKGVAGLYDRVSQSEVDAKKDRADIEANRKELEDTRPAVRRRIPKPKES